MSTQLILLKRTFDPMEAHVIRGLLESNDIPAFVMDDQHSTIAWHMQIALGGARVMVLTEDLEAARALLREQTDIAPDPIEAPAPSYFLRLWQIVVFFWTGLPMKFRNRYPETKDHQQ